MCQYHCSSIGESAKIVDIVEQPKTYLVFLGIHHLTIHDLDEIISMGKWRNLEI